MGEFKSGSEELLADGGVRESYVDGTDGRTSEIRYICGSSEPNSRTFEVEEPSSLTYVWTVSGPQFCAWREQDSGQARDKEGKPETRIVSINEGSLCEYEMVIQTTLLCGHDKFLPTLPRGQETIQCVAEPGD